MSGQTAPSVSQRAKKEGLVPAERIPLSENQHKVIQSKYLKKGESVENWLARVARNIASAELLYAPESHRWGLFDGVRVAKKEFLRPAPIGKKAQETTRVWLFHGGLDRDSERESNFVRFVKNCGDTIETYPEAKAAVQPWENEFYDMMSYWRFLPNSPTLMNAGMELQQLSACYVLPVEDSLEGITDALQAQALIHKSGGGTGFSFGRLRPAGDTVKSTAGIASGAISFLQVFDKMTGIIKQGGSRRGANMGILPYWHPEIKEFIQLKNRPRLMENFNLSVAVDEKFMDAVETDQQYDLINPRTGQPVGRLSARDMFNRIVESAWRSGDPGVIFLNHINKPSSNPTPELGKIEATNPCGEQPLLPNEPCNLGSINLSVHVVGELTQGSIDWDLLEKTIRTSIRFLDNVIDMNNYPLPEIELLAKTNRRIGLGLMGWAETLVKMGIPYDSDQAVQFAKEMMAFINKKACEASEELALERGVFPNWNKSIYDPDGPHFKGEALRVRHCARTTIAPTGTIALAAGLQGAGIEPFYAIAYTRYSGKAIDAIQAGRAPEAEDVFFEVNPLFRAVAQRHNFFGLKEQDLWRKIEKNGRSIRGLSEIPEDIQRLFATAHDVPVEAHVKIQAAFQEHTDNAVSKTINLKNSATIEDVRRAYTLAYKMKCKGITVYRDGSKQQQVLNLFPETKPSKRSRDLTQGISSEYYEIKTGHGPLHIHINYDNQGPFQMFTSLAPLGTEIAGLTSSLGILISKYLEEGGDPNRLLRHLQSVKGDRPFGFGESRVDSIPHAIAVALRTHLEKHGWLETKPSQEELVSAQPPLEEGSFDASHLELWNLSRSADHCPDCHGRNVSFASACNGLLCHDCGYSECN